MIPFLRGFTYHQNTFLREFAASNATFLPPNPCLTRELCFWTRALLHFSDFTPIPTLISDPPFVALHFFSDAAGTKHYLTLSGHTRRDFSPDPGAASIGFLSTTSRIPFFASILLWPPSLLELSNTHSTLLEFLALLLPFLGLKQNLREMANCASPCANLQ